MFVEEKNNNWNGNNRYQSFLSELANGVFLKSHNGSSEKSQIYEGFVAKRVSDWDQQLSYSQVFSIRNVSGTVMMNKSHDEMNDYEERFPNLSNYGSFSRNEKNLQQEVTHRNFYIQNLQQGLFNEDEVKIDKAEKYNTKSNFHKFERNIQYFSNISYKQDISIDKYISNCYDCIDKISAGFDDIIYYGNSLREEHPVDILRRSQAPDHKALGYDHFHTENDKSDSNESISITGHFLNTALANTGSQNRVIFKNNSANLGANYSSEDIDDYGSYMRRKEYCSLGNLYSTNDISGLGETQKQSKLSLISQRMETLDDPVFEEKEYKEWLIKNNLIKYTTYSNTNSFIESRYSAPNTEMPTICKSISSLDDYIIHCSTEEDISDRKFMEVHCYNIYEMITYEHLVVINFLTFFTSYFSVRRMYKLTINDHIFQIIFFALCYGIFVIIKNSHVGLTIN